LLGGAIRGPRTITLKTLDDEPKWRVPGKKLRTGYKSEWR
jgi:hydrogenase small subunit